MLVFGFNQCKEEDKKRKICNFSINADNILPHLMQDIFFWSPSKPILYPSNFVESLTLDGYIKKW